MSDAIALATTGHSRLVGQQTLAQCMCTSSVWEGHGFWSLNAQCAANDCRLALGSNKRELRESQESGQKIWIIDTFPYNGEMVAELRLKHLFNDVDEFIVVESRVTHSGKQKDTLYVDRDLEEL